MCVFVWKNQQNTLINTNIECLVRKPKFISKNILYILKRRQKSQRNENNQCKYLLTHPVQNVTKYNMKFIQNNNSYNKQDNQNNITNQWNYNRTPSPKMNEKSNSLSPIWNWTRYLDFRFCWFYFIYFENIFRICICWTKNRRHETEIILFKSNFLF